MKKISVTVGISAFNEEASIGQLLHCILAEKQTNFILKEIIVISDKCTDSTDKIVLSLKSPKIRLIRNAVQKGKARNLNTIFSKATGDIIILLDADITLKKGVLSNLVSPFISIPNIAMVAGNALPKSPETFVEKSIYASFIAYEWMKIKINNGNNVYNVKGCVLAFSREFAKKVVIPSNIFADDIFLYFSCISQGKKFHFVKNAVVRYRMPQTLSDHVRQNRRWSASPSHIKETFGELVDQEYQVPLKLKIQSLLYGLLKDPIHSLAIFVINSYCRWSLTRTPYKKPMWASVTSTKKSL